MAWVAVILAGGKGVRMRSRLPKVLHPVAGQPMVAHVVNALEGLELSRRLVVLGPQTQAVREQLGDGLSYALQPEPLGTGHALLCARDALDGKVDSLLVLAGDVPLLRAETIRALVERHVSSRAIITMLTARTQQTDGLGRVVRDGAGRVTAIVEEREATPAQRQIDEINSGIYCFQASWLWPNLAKLSKSPSGEFYLTDLVQMAVESGQGVESVEASSFQEVMGVNNRIQLAQAEAAMRQRVRERLMLSGVTIIDPLSTFIDASVEIGEDTVIYPNTTIQGRTVIGEGCRIGPGSIIIDSQIGDDCRILASVVEGSVLEEHVEMGPFCHIRPESHLGKRVHLGNFGEVKKSRLGPGVQMGHFSYIGDAQIGANVNIGAGTITCNYDGVRKNPTFIGDDAFIGSDSMLVAPLRIGARAITGAGSVVNKDVPDDMLAVGVPARLRAKGQKADDGQASAEATPEAQSGEDT
ncbi:MAG: bifunctional UDP-N-acetylglucosamine diphosphorylase/glucosamine-1-phosphate N-acetyltransferase GlmU [Chloroflexi bacterium]|nr:bifunctional UDP-N-acetylglucosamine diphosphorylase/glucosamine-1-phosphate N-acetyltransferase GlmU [Chloroflexota bacterium]